MNARAAQFLNWLRSDPGIATLVFVAGAVASVGFSATPALVADFSLTGRWFESDYDVVFQNITDANSNHFRSTVKHPLFSILANTPARVLMVVGFSPVAAVVFLTALATGACGLFAFLTLRNRQIAPLTSAIYAGAVLFSAGVLFWSTLPDTFIFGTATILAALWLAARGRERNDGRAHIAVNVLAAGVTVTNWLPAGVATFLTKARGEWVRIFLWVGGIAVVLKVLQRVLYPSAGITGFLTGMPGETKYLFHEMAGTLFDKVKTMLVWALYAPAPEVTGPLGEGETGRLTFVGRTVFSSDVLFTLGALIVLAAVVGGIVLCTRALWRAKGQDPLLATLLVALAANLGLHSVWGDEIFLYVAHWAPLLVLGVALGVQNFRPRLTLPIGGLLLALFVLNNPGKLLLAQETMATLSSLPTN